MCVFNSIIHVHVLLCCLKINTESETNLQLGQTCLQEETKVNSRTAKREQFNRRDFLFLKRSNYTIFVR